jgi:hypothetical protein
VIRQQASRQARPGRRRCRHRQRRPDLAELAAEVDALWTLGFFGVPAIAGCETISAASHRLEAPTLVLYEYPFNESIRTMLRLEHLFKRLTLLVPRDEPVDHHFALVTVFEIMDVASRPT